MYLGQALYFRGGGLMNVLRASIFRYGALKQPHGHENRLIHSSTGGVGRVIEMLEVRSCGTVTPVDITLAQLRDEARVGTRELLQMERPLSSSTQPRILCPGHSIPFHLGAARGVIFPQKILLACIHTLHLPRHCKPIRTQIARMPQPSSSTVER